MYSANVDHLQSIPASIASAEMSSARSMLTTTRSRRSGREGASVKPQFPMIVVVTPCQQTALPTSSQNTCASMCECESMNPGATMWPSASISSRPRPSISPTAAMRSATIATSPRTPGVPVPSTTSPPRMTRSNSADVAVMRQGRKARRSCHERCAVSRHGARLRTYRRESCGCWARSSRSAGSHSPT